MTLSRRSQAALLALAIVIILAFLALPPVAPLDKADFAAYAVCHRITERTFIFGGRPLPLCARCSGTYLGAAAALAALAFMGRGRSGHFPARRWWPVLGVFVLAWAVDGANSFLTLIPPLPHLYEPSNMLRLLTGTLQGVVLAVILLPAFNLALWREPAAVAPLERRRDLLAVTAAAALLAVPVATEWDPLLYPLALLSGAAILLLLGAVNTMLVLVVLRQEGRGTQPLHALAPFLAGAALACIEIFAIAAVRTFLTARFGLPF